MPRRSKLGIFCVESDWTSDLRDRLSAQPLLDMLEKSGQIRSMHRKVSTPEDLTQRLQQWTQKKYSNYTFAYLALHGEEGRVRVGRRNLPLADLAESLRGSLTGKTIHFGSCSTFNIEEADIAHFRKVTGAQCICGYTSDVDWMESAAFEILLFAAFAWYQRINAIDNYIGSHYGDLAAHLGFQMHYGAINKARRPSKK